MDGVVTHAVAKTEIVEAAIGNPEPGGLFQKPLPCGLRRGLSKWEIAEEISHEGLGVKELIENFSVRKFVLHDAAVLANQL